MHGLRHGRIGRWVVRGKRRPDSPVRGGRNAALRRVCGNGDGLMAWMKRKRKLRNSSRRWQEAGDDVIRLLSDV